MLWTIAVMAILNVFMVVLTLGVKTARTVRKRGLEARSAEPESTLDGPEAVPHVAPLLAFEDETVRAVAAKALALTDPSSLRVWDYPHEAAGLRAVEVPGLRVYPSLRDAGEPSEEEVQRLDYSWGTWEDPAFHERKKKGFATLREAYAGREPVREPESSDVAAGPDR